MKQQPPTNYNEYRKLQVDANVRKLHRVWATPDEMRRVADAIRANTPEPTLGLCHGARNGQEVRLLLEELPEAARVIGTDISPTADAIEHMTTWDFHDPNPDWHGRADFIYSNSWDHTYDIDRIAHVWAGTLAPGGTLILHWTRHHDVQGIDGPDIFGCSEDALVETFTARGLVEQGRVRFDGGQGLTQPGRGIPLREGAASPLAHAKPLHYVNPTGQIVLIVLRKPAS